MNDRFFLDTNVFVYSFDVRAQQKSDQAKQLIRRAIDSGKGMISYQVAQEFLNVALRRFSHPMTVADAEQYLSVTFRPLLKIHSSQGLYSEALRLSAKYNFSWYGALIAASAIEGRCGILYSEDFRDGQRFGDLVVQNPFR